MDSGKDTIEYTDYDFIQNSGSEYTIVLPAETLYNERLAADEINSFVFEASGIKLPCVADTDVEYSADAKLIILGNTAFNDKSGVDFSFHSRTGIHRKDSGFQCVYMRGKLRRIVRGI